MLFFQLGLPVPPTPRQRSFCHQRGKTLAKTLRLHVAALVLLSFLSGCSLSPLAKRTADFSSAAAATSIDTASAYQIVERAHYDTEVATLVANYDTDGFHPEKIKPFLKPEDQETRTRILNGLTQYAETLAEVSGDQPLADVDKQAAVLGNSLKDLSKSSDQTVIDLLYAFQFFDELAICSSYMILKNIYNRAGNLQVILIDKSIDRLDFSLRNLRDK